MDIGCPKMCWSAEHLFKAEKCRDVFSVEKLTLTTMIFWQIPTALRAGNIWCCGDPKHDLCMVHVLGGCSIDELTRCHFGSSPGHRLSFLLQPSNGRWGRWRVEGPGQEKTTTRRVWRDWNPSEISPEEEATATRNRGWIPSDNPGGCET